jgi:hypothetical protein
VANLPLPVVGLDADHSDFKEADSGFGHVPNMRSKPRLFQSCGAGLKRRSHVFYDDDIKLKQRTVLVIASAIRGPKMVIVQNRELRIINYDNFISVAVCGKIGIWLSMLFKRFASGR